MLNTEEMNVITMLTDAYTAFVALPTAHSDDVEMFSTAINSAQNVVMARSAIREHPEEFSHDSSFK
jgi:hypothetical protein